MSQARQGMWDARLGLGDSRVEGVRFGVLRGFGRGSEVGFGTLPDHSSLRLCPWEVKVMKKP